MAQMPPLNALRALEAAARHLSISKAADELYVTKAAVSHQIKSLEEYLGFPLFERKSRGIELSPAVEVALPKLRDGFNNLSEAVALMRQEMSHESIRVCMAPSFAAKWLVPRLQGFSQKYPEIDMQLSSDEILITDLTEGRLDEWFRSEQADLMIRFGDRSYSGYQVDKLFDVVAVPLCSPELRDKGEHPLRTPEDLRHHTLLHDDTGYTRRPTWQQWMSMVGVEGIDASRGLHFNQVLLVMGAAIDGQGVGLSMEALAKRDIERGLLCVPFEGEEYRMPLDAAYHVIRPINTRKRETVDLFVEWLMEEAKAL